MAMQLPRFLICTSDESVSKTMNRSASFLVSKPDCNANFYVEQDESDGAFCSVCGLVKKDFRFSTRDIKKRTMKENWGATYDGHTLVTSKVLKHLRSLNVPFKVVEANKQPKLYSIKFSKSFPFDAKSTGTRFIDKCQVCGEYESVVGMTPVTFEKDPNIDPNLIYQSDLSFGSGREKGSVVVAGEKVARILESNYPELYLHPTVIR